MSEQEQKIKDKFEIKCKKCGQDAEVSYQPGYEDCSVCYGGHLEVSCLSCGVSVWLDDSGAEYK